MIRSTLTWLSIAGAALALAAAPAAALSLQAAKKQGYVGEQPDGYLGVRPNAPADAATLAKDVNQKRKRHYQEIAKKRGTSVEQVAKLAGAKLIGEAGAGEWVRQGGKWVQK